jgi:uncharacterized protein (TIGR00661 family)
MFIQNINRKKVLISPLDWGLGHTTRCITIVRKLLDTNVSIIVACNPVQKELLQQEFNNIEFLLLEGYDITYSKNQLLFPIKLLFQLPKIILSIKREHRWLQKTIENHQIDLVISDNRYGLYTSKVPCFFITHQLAIKAPFSWLEYLLQKINYGFINRFAHCWVPDFEGEKNIAGVLSHPKRLPSIPVHYIGPLARLVKDNNAPIRYQFCIILSGPEPQRTILEDTILQQLATISSKCLLVRGRLNTAPISATNPNVSIENHLKGADLQAAIQASEFVITRSGYTSVMELLSLQKKCILIPTPGQTEQEYLAKQLMKQKWAWCIDQKDFNLIDSLEQASNFNYCLPDISTDLLGDVIKKFL